MKIRTRKLRTRSRCPTTVLVGLVGFVAGGGSVCVFLAAHFRTEGSRKLEALTSFPRPELERPDEWTCTRKHEASNNEPVGRISASVSLDARDKAGMSSANAVQKTNTKVSAPRTQVDCRTTSTGYEILLDSIIGGIFREEGLLPPGSVLDVGAQVCVC